MILRIDADQDPRTGWEGYDFLVNRRTPGPETAHLERHVGPGWAWAEVAEVPARAAADHLQVTIPRAALGLPAATTATRIDFKWVDNLQQPGNVMDFSTSGDVAPAGRFRFRYEAP